MGFKSIQKKFFELHYLAKRSVAKPTTSYDLVILDDYSPDVISAFRAFEFSFLLKNIENSALYTMMAHRLSPHIKYDQYKYKRLNEFNEKKEEFSSVFRLPSQQIQTFYPWTKLNTKVVYIVFLSNAIRVIDYLEENGIKFILELYPGGGFAASTNAPQFANLKRVLRSPFLERVIVTQKLSNQFLLENSLCEEDKIEFKYGGVLSLDLLNIPEKKIKFGHNKDTLDICFTAAKYMEKGLDKGYDIFIKTACALLEFSDQFRFHIVGGFSFEDIEIEPKYKDRFKFYGFLKSSDFVQHYQDKDIILSPSRPFLLGDGFFDGFPTATCAEASLNGLCMVLSDPLNQNVILKDKYSAIFVENSIDQCVKAILDLYHNPEIIYKVGTNGKVAFQELDYHDQLNFRLNIIKKSIND